jgi:hypothetical protein
MKREETILENKSIKIILPPRRGYLAFLNVNKPGYFLIFAI